MRTPAFTAIRASFHAGRYAEALNAIALAGADSPGDPTGELEALRVGAHSFRGEALEALSAFHRLERLPRAAPSAIVQARFFLAIGYVRRSEYAEARKLFARNLREKAGSSEIDFYRWQGLAFFRFFFGRFRRARALAERAYLAATELDFPYGRVLALDLLAHSHCQLGQARRGLKDFETALALARVLGNGGIQSAVEISMLRFRSQFGLNLARAERELERAIRQLASRASEDTYSRAELVLELSRQRVLRGRATAARELLEAHCDSIYRHQNRRQSATLHLRMSHLLHLRGESYAALTLLRSALAALDARVDQVYRAQLRGLERKILRETGTSLPPETSCRNALDSRISQRDNGAIAPRDPGEDPLGDWFDRASQRADADFPAVIESGLLYLVPPFLAISSAAPSLVLGPVRGMGIACARGDVHVIPHGFTTPIRKLLRLLAAGSFQKKEKLVREVWGYAYRPDRHDALLHATLARARKLLGPFETWIEWSAGGYRLRGEVRLLEADGAPAKARVSLPATLPTTSSSAPRGVSEKPPAADLNYRQFQALNWIERGEYLSVSDYARRLQVSKITACRDLTQLARWNMVSRSGKARATRYGKRETP